VLVLIENDRDEPFWERSFAVNDAPVRSRVARPRRRGTRGKRNICVA